MILKESTMCKLRVRALSWPFIVKVGLVGGQLGLFVLPLNKGLNGRYTHDVCNDGQNLTKGVVFGKGQNF